MLSLAVGLVLGWGGARPCGAPRFVLRMAPAGPPGRVGGAPFWPLRALRFGARARMNPQALCSSSLLLLSHPLSHPLPLFLSVSFCFSFAALRVFRLVIVFSFFWGKKKGRRAWKNGLKLWRIICLAYPDAPAPMRRARLGQRPACGARPEQGLSAPRWECQMAAALSIRGPNRDKMKRCASARRARRGSDRKGILISPTRARAPGAGRGKGKHGRRKQSSSLF